MLTKRPSHDRRTRIVFITPDINDTLKLFAVQQTSREPEDVAVTFDVVPRSAAA